jgi:hypothetical protein
VIFREFKAARSNVLISENGFVGKTDRTVVDLWHFSKSVMVSGVGSSARAAESVILEEKMTAATLAGYSSDDLGIINQVKGNDGLALLANNTYRLMNPTR